ncbi:MAG: hypothetical protein ABI851_10880 [Saprospiraceae bacterium]
MDYLKQFSLPFKGMTDGSHEYRFELDSRFFDHFSESPIQKSQIDVLIQAEKQGSYLTVDFIISGLMMTGCDRCLAEINLPINGRYHFIIKKALGESEDPDLIFVNPDTTEWLIADLLYEFSCLSIPISKEIECSRLENPPCDFDVLNRIQKETEKAEDNSIWEDLKRLNIK